MIFSDETTREIARWSPFDFLCASFVSCARFGQVLLALRSTLI